MITAGKSLFTWTALTAVTALALLGSACGNAQTERARAILQGKSAGERDSELKRFYDQKPTWKACEEAGKGGRLECATVEVPLDYTDPEGETIRIAVNRVRAESPKRRLGSLLTSADRAGDSGLEDLEKRAYALGLLRKRYDLVGFDQRGAGRSSPVECMTDRQQDAFYATDFTPDTEAEHREAQDAVRSYAERCHERSGDLLPHVGTENVARDLDIIRAALGDEKLNYLGTAYGTLPGQEYARQFPRNLGRMVLDSVEDPGQQAGKGDEGRNAALEKNLRAIFKACSKRSMCEVGETRAQAMAVFDELLENLEGSPVHLPDGRELTDTLARLAAARASSDPSDYGRDLTAGIIEANAGYGQKLMALADAYLERDPETGRYGGRNDAAYAVRCLVDDAGHPRTPDPTQAAKKRQAEYAEAVETSPHFGALDYFDEACDFWPVPATRKARPITGTGHAPILLVNNTKDPTAPLAGAQEVARNLPNARLIVNRARGHGVYASGHDCADDAIEGFLLDGKAPPTRKTCRK